MGRPREHDERTGSLLLAAAERLVTQGGIDAVGVRSAAEAAGTTTRAVYALFGSKEGLLQGLAQRSFQLLTERVDSVPMSEDPGADLIRAAVYGFRAFSLEHPDLFRLFFLPSPSRAALGSEAASAAMYSYSRLIERVERAHAAGLLGNHSVTEVTALWDATCSGLAMFEICRRIEPALAEQIWLTGLSALLAGLGAVPARSTG